MARQGVTRISLQSGSLTDMGLGAPDHDAVVSFLDDAERKSPGAASALRVGDVCLL